MRLVLDRLPPLRERVQDILPLTEFFVAKFAASLNKPIDLIPDEVMAVLKAHDWPGNIRELQNFIERAVLFSPGSVLRLPLDFKHTVKQSSGALHARRGDATYHDRLFYLSLEKKLQSPLHRSRAADLIQRIEAAVLAAASERRSEHLRRLAELR
jgi:DNA-binding NtrC family response regulator